jgi:uncharacterized protein
MRYLMLSIVFSLIFSQISAQNLTLSLYPEGIPCASELKEEVYEVGISGRRIQKVQSPELVAFLALENMATGASVIICPGGGYTVLAWDWEGTWMAEWFNSIGVNAFVLKYRLPRWESEACRDKVALMDAQRAMRLVRSKARDWNLDPDRVGIMGFSAGGHLASSLSTHFDAGDPQATLEVDGFSCRPDFSILMYPVISMDPSVGHGGSRRNLIGDQPTAESEMYFSNEKQVTAETPPAILIHASDDQAVIPQNSLLYYQALVRHQIPVALHIYESGGHGFSFAKNRGSVESWPETVHHWLKNRGLVDKKIKALIIEGQNNHKNWAETTLIMKDHLINSGLFSVEVVRTPDTGESMADFRPDFSRFDVVVSNYNGDLWPTETRADFESFIRGGGGFVSVHAANNAFAQWPAYNEMIGLGGWEGRSEKDGPYVYINQEGKLVRDEKPGPGGHHGKQHAFTIELRDTTHPVTRGLPRKWMHARDELYDQLRGPAINMQILATAYSDPETGGTDRHEPMLMALHYGYGRVFHTTLGHLNESMEHFGFKTTFLRGVEWAATGKVTQPVPPEFQGLK